MFRKAILILAAVAVGIYASPHVAAAVDVDANHPLTLVIGGGVMGCLAMVAVTARRP